MAQYQQIWEWTDVHQARQRTAERPEPSPGQVEVEIRSIGICGTDVHIMSGEAGFSEPPLPLGHELAGIVSRVGEQAGQAGDWQPGDRVCIDPLIGCGSCEACLAGNKHHCPFGGEIGLHYAGGWQQYLNVPAANLYRVPDTVSLEEASQAETLHCCVGALDKLDIQPGAAATVIGDGPTGLYFVQLLKAAGAAPVTLVGMQPHRLALGLQLGADAAIDLSASASDTACALLPAEESQAIVIEAAGAEAALRLGIGLLRRGGQLLLFGLPSQAVQVDIQTVVLKELRLIGSTNAPQVWPRVLELMASGAAAVAPLITQRYGFDELDEAVAFARQHPGEAIKVIVNVNAGATTNEEELA